MGKTFLVFFTTLFLFSIDLTAVTINNSLNRIVPNHIKTSEQLNQEISPNQNWFDNQYRLDIELDLIINGKEWRRLGSWLKYNANFIKNSYFQRKVLNLIKRNMSEVSEEIDLAYIYDQCFELYDKCAGDETFVESYRLANPDGKDQFLFWAYKFWVNGISIKKLGLDDQQKKILFNINSINNKDVLSHFKKLYWKKGYDDIIDEIPLFIEKISVDTQAQKEKLRELLVKAYFKTKQYSVLSALLKKKDWRSQYAVNSKTKLMLEFRIALKKGALNRASQIVREMDKGADEQVYHRSVFALAHRVLIRKNYRRALELYQKIDLKFLKKNQVESLKWNLFKIYQHLGSKTEIRKLFTWAENHPFGNLETASKFCYWGKKLNLSPENGAKNCSEKYPNTYYGLHLQKETKEVFQLERWKNIVDHKVLLSSNEMNFLKMVDQVYGERKIQLGDFLVTSYFNINLRLPYFQKIGQVLLQHQRYHLLQRLIGGHYLSVIRKDALESKKVGLLALYYPKAYREIILKYSQKYKVPEFLIYSVMREESRFKDEVISGAGAIGLMQLMPRTAKYIAKRLRVKLKEEHLTHPETNIMLGAKYLSRLLKRFDGNLFYVLAAYNGGPTNAKRWIKKYQGRDINQFIEAITFQETQNYVKRVMKSFYTYQLLYDLNKAS